jgi:hypothetical protein
MTRTITKQEAAGAIDELTGSLSNDLETIIVDDEGKRIAVVISPEEFDRLAISRAWETVRSVQDRNADKDPDEVLEFVTDVVNEIRRERNEKRRAASSGG